MTKIPFSGGIAERVRNASITFGVERETLEAGRFMKKLLLLLLFAAFPINADIYDIKQLDLKSYQGRVVYLDFWASWCKPCRKSFPWMNELLTKYPAERFTVVTVNLDAESESMHQFLAKVPAKFVPAS